MSRETAIPPSPYGMSHIYEHKYILPLYCNITIKFRYVHHNRNNAKHDDIRVNIQ